MSDPVEETRLFAAVLRGLDAGMTPGEIVALGRGGTTT